MKPLNEIILASATSQDMKVIETLAKSFDLDCEDLKQEEFITAKRNGYIIGFGRLRKYNDCTELATLGVVEEERANGIGALIVEKLIALGPEEIFITNVIPEYAKRFGFIQTNKYPNVLRKKVDFCKSYGYKEEEVFVMKLIKPKQ